MPTALKDAALSGTISYNGFEFSGSGSTPPTYTIEAEPIYDEAERSITHVRYLLDITTIVYGQSESESATQIEQLRQQLSRPGRKLIIADIGFGDTTVESGSSHPDIAWGAKPRVLRLEPVGGMLAWQLHWQCEFQISETASSSSTSGNWLAFNFSHQYDIDAEGFTSRRVTGYVTLPQSRLADGKPNLVRDIDRVRDRLLVLVPDGFRRLRSKWTESADKSRLDFTIVDEQLRDTPYPSGIVDAKVKYELKNHGTGFSRFRATLSGSMETAPGVPTMLATQHLLMIAQDKSRRLQIAAAAAGGGLIMPTQIGISHNLFSRRTSLEIEFEVVQCLYKMLTTTGMWDPIPGSDYRRWRTSVEHLWKNRGTAGLKASEHEGAIIDLIDNPVDGAVIGSSPSAAAVTGSLSRSTLLIPTIERAASWLDYQVRITIHRRENSSLHRLATDVNMDAISSSTDQESGVGARYRTADIEAGTVREVHGEPMQQVRLEGEAVRLRYRPNVPVLRSVGGRSVCQRDSTEQREVVGNYCGVPAYRLSWSVLYDVSGHISKYDPPVSPVADPARRITTDL